MDKIVSYTQTADRWVRDVATAPAGYHRADRPGLPAAWWRANPRYTLYMVRELSSVTNALWSVRLLMQLSRLQRGRAAYEAFLAAQRRPPWMIFSLVALILSGIHSMTFLQAAGKGPTLHLGTRPVAEQAIARAAFAGWASTSLTVLITLVAGGRGKTVSGEGQ